MPSNKIKHKRQHWFSKEAKSMNQWEKWLKNIKEKFKMQFIVDEHHHVVISVIAGILAIETLLAYKWKYSLFSDFYLKIACEWITLCNYHTKELCFIIYLSKSISISIHTIPVHLSQSIPVQSIHPSPSLYPLYYCIICMQKMCILGTFSSM